MSGNNPLPPRAAILALAVPLIEQFEGFQPSPYLCPAGIATIGFGTTRYPNGKAVTLKDRPVTQDEALMFLKFSLGETLDSLADLLRRPPTVHQAAALLSFAYNEGVAALMGSSILARFNAGDLAGAAAHFADWNKAHVGRAVVTLEGLTRRRTAEAALFETPDAPINHLVV